MWYGAERGFTRLRTARRARSPASAPFRIQRARFARLQGALADLALRDQVKPGGGTVLHEIDMVAKLHGAAAIHFHLQVVSDPPIGFGLRPTVPYQGLFAGGRPQVGQIPSRTVGRVVLLVVRWKQTVRLHMTCVACPRRVVIKSHVQFSRRHVGWPSRPINEAPHSSAHCPCGMFVFRASRTIDSLRCRYSHRQERERILPIFVHFLGGVTTVWHSERKKSSIYPSARRELILSYTFGRRPRPTAPFAS